MKKTTALIILLMVSVFIYGCGVTASKTQSKELLAMENGETILSWTGQAQNDRLKLTNNGEMYIQVDGFHGIQLCSRRSNCWIMMNEGPELLEKAFHFPYPPRHGGVGFDLRKGYYFVVSAYDFDKDGVKEVILAVGNKKTNISIGIYKAEETLNVNEDFVQPKRIGFIKGKGTALIKTDGTIETGSENYKYQEGQFLKR